MGGAAKAKPTPKAVTRPSSEAGSSKPQWRDRAAKVRKVSQCNGHCEVAADCLAMFADDDGCSEVKLLTIQNAAKRLRGDLEDEKFMSFLRGVDGRMTEEGLQIRDRLEKSVLQLTAVESVLVLLGQECGSVEEAARLHIALREVENAGGTVCSALKVRAVRSVCKAAARLQRFDVCLACMEQGADAVNVMHTFMRPALGGVDAYSLALVPVEAANASKQEMLYDILTIAMWDKDRPEVAQKMLSSLVARAQLFGGEVDNLRIMEKAFGPFSLSVRSLHEWQELRANTRAGGRLMRQFANLPVGLNILSQLDAFILRVKKDRMHIEQIETLQRQLNSSEAGDHLQSEHSKCVAFFARLKKELLGIVANCDLDFVSEQQSLLATIADKFEEVIRRISVGAASRFDSSLKDVLMDVFMLAKSPKDAAPAEEYDEKLSNLTGLILSAEDSGMNSIGVEDDARHWVAQSNCQKQLVEVLRTCVHYYLHTDEAPKTSSSQAP